MSGQLTTIDDTEKTPYDIQVHIDSVNGAVQNIEYHVWELKRNRNWKKFHISYATWEEFCQAQFGKSAVHCGRLADHYEIRQSLSRELQPTAESQSRVLISIPAEYRQEVMQEAKKTAPDNKHIPGAKQISAAHIASVAARIVPAPVQEEFNEEKQVVNIAGKQRETSFRKGNITRDYSPPSPIRETLFSSAAPVAEVVEPDTDEEDIDELPRLVRMERLPDRTITLHLFFPDQAQSRPFRVRNDGGF
jgi:hypothetical protein